MSKSRGNVVNPDDIVNEYGADTMRLYEMFIGDFEKPPPGPMPASRAAAVWWSAIGTCRTSCQEQGIRPDMESDFHKASKRSARTPRC